MARRAGRKRKNKNFQAALNGTRRTSRHDHGTAELLQHRVALVGAHHATSQLAGDPLGVLVLAGVITEQQRQAGIGFAELHVRMYGRPQASTGQLNGDVSFGRLVRGGNFAAADEATTAAYKRLRKRLNSAGKIAVDEVRLVAVEQKLPSWQVDPRPGDQRRIRALRCGLERLR